MENWLGQAEIRVDEKGRFSLPSSALGLFPNNELILSVGVFVKKSFLELLTIKEWKEKMSTLQGPFQKDPRLKAYKRFLSSGSSKVSIDKQNRVIIPGFQRKLIKLGKKAVVINLENKIELWSADLWAGVLNDFINDFEDLEGWVNGFDKTKLKEEKEHELKPAA